jgi:transitional endoplasmic reticulum ATPase
MAAAAPDRTSLTLRLAEARPADVGRGFARLDPADLRRLGVASGDVVAIRGARNAYARVLPCGHELRGQSLVAVDGAIRRNAGLAAGETATVASVEARAAASIRLQVADAEPNSALAMQLRTLMLDIPVSVGDRLTLRRLGGRAVDVEVTGSDPGGPVMAGRDTRVDLARAPGKAERGVTYDDLGGMKLALARVREVVELPLRRPELFELIGIDAPRGVLLSGPPGTGKTLLARAVAEECAARFFQIAGPEIVGRHYGESEEQLRQVFADAQKRQPSIVFIDEIDAIAPKRESLTSDRQVERRIVAQLLTLMDGLKDRGQVIVLAATNLPDQIDPALRRPGRFDREIRIDPPDRIGRREILEIHMRGMPLAEDVDLEALARDTHGYVGADLAALAREAGLAALRRHDAFAPDGALDFAAIRVAREDFAAAFAEIRPSAIREIFTDVPDIGFSDVAGLEEAKAALTEAVLWPLEDGALFERLGLRPTRGILLAGPPGTGKTLLAKALANEAGVNFVSIKGPELLAQYVGESERAIRTLFAKARMLAPCIVFFDEIDALAPRRGRDSAGVGDRVVAQLLTEIDGVVALPGVFLLAATNRVDLVDPALVRPGRFDMALEIGPPDGAARKAILALNAGGFPGVEACDVAGLAAAADGLSGAETAEVARRAGFSALRRARAEGGEPIVTDEDFAAALASVRKGRGG